MNHGKRMSIHDRLLPSGQQQNDHMCAYKFVDSLKVCAKDKNLCRGSRLHADILKHGLLGTSPYVATALINMYAKCGVLARAHQVFEEIPAPNVVTWNALIAGYAHDGRGQEALECLERMQRECMTPDGVTFICTLKACGSTGALDKGKQIHNKIVMNEGLLEKNIVLGNALVDMYAKCGALSKARIVLDMLPARDIVSWSALIAGYAQKGQGHEALECFGQMQMEGLSPDEVTFICALKACGSIGAIDKGMKIHDAIVNRGMLQNQISLSNALLDMYVKCGLLEKAQRVLEEIPIRNVVSWSALIAGYTHKGQGHKALDCFEQMQREGLSPNDVTFICILKACGSLRAVNKGKQIHDHICNSGMLKKNIVLGNALVDMYAKCGLLAKAQQVLEELPVRDIVSWSALITGYAHGGQGHEALECFAQMQREGHFPTDVTFICALKACGSIGAIDNGKQIHDQIVNWGLLDKSIMVGNVLVDMYAKCGVLSEARLVLEGLPVRDVVSWNALIAGYAQAEKGGNEVMNCFVKMQREGITPNMITFTSILKACGNIGAIDKGQQIHEHLLNGCMLEHNIVLGTALVDMYAKCGVLSKAQEMLEQLPVRNIISWNSLIAGYAQEGHCHEVLKCFEQMQKEGFVPDEVTFLSMLSACSHSGKFDEAQWYYENMSRVYGIAPKLEHHTCMVVIFGCAGRFEKAMSVMKTMPSTSDPSVWLAFLSSCKKWGNVALGRLAFDEVMHQDMNIPAAYILMADIYAAAGMQKDAETIDALRVEKCCTWKK